MGAGLIITLKVGQDILQRIERGELVEITPEGDAAPFRIYLAGHQQQPLNKEKSL